MVEEAVGGAVVDLAGVAEERRGGRSGDEPARRQRRSAQSASSERTPALGCTAVCSRCGRHVGEQSVVEHARQVEDAARRSAAR